MKILSTDQIRAADAYTIANEPIESIDLMERASEAFVEAFIDLPLNEKAVTVFCGPGNNGGDGLAVARLLAKRNFKVGVCMVKIGSRLSPDCKTNLDRWNEIGDTIEIDAAEQLHDLELNPVIIDAIFGSGISRGITGFPGQVVEYLNSTQKLIVSIDMPSGLFADQPNQEGAIIQASYTLSFQVPKLAFFLPQNDQYVGDWNTLDIGLDQDFIDQVESNYCAVDSILLQQFNQESNRFAHKGSYGHALLVAGSLGKMGAAVLSAKAALRSGLGLLTVHVPGCGLDIVQTAVPEAMCQIDANEHYCTQVSASDRINVIGLGPGLGQESQTVAGIRSLLEESSVPMVIDADGLNILSQHHELIELLPENAILTPHPKEFERLAGKPHDDYHRLELQRQFAAKNKVIVVYKGAFTTIALPNGQIFFNTTGNPGMATAGSGDVLTGVITGLLTRTRNPALAALFGVFVHGLAGDLAEKETSTIALLAGDIVNYLGPAIRKTNLLL